MKEKELQIFLTKILNKKYNNVITRADNYIVAAGEGPICLIAHLDTVLDKPPKVIFHDKEYNVMWSPAGLGADDRAGIWIILELLKKGYRPSIVFTLGEEIGGIGAIQLITDYPEINKILPDVKFLIELDRQGHDDAVYYHCDNEVFEEWIQSYGFRKDWGTFTDISIIAPKWKTAAVNLSVGYFNEHTQLEHLMLNDMYKTMIKVEAMLKDTGSGHLPASYEYIPEKPKKIIQRKFSINACPLCNVKLTETNKVLVNELFVDIKYICEDCYREYFT